MTCLMIAARNGHIEAVSLLIQHGADKEAKDKQNINPNPRVGKTALFYSLLFEQLGTLNVLLENGANMEAKWK